MDIFGGGYPGYPGIEFGSRLPPVAQVTKRSVATSITLGASAVETPYDITLTGNATISLGGALPGVLQRIVLWLRQDSTGGRTPTLPPQGTAVRYAGGTAPSFSSTAAGSILRVTFETLDGGATWLGLSGGV